MINVMFVCLGNVCRSPMAEFVFKDMLEKRYLSYEFNVASAATNSFGLGSRVNPDARRKLLSVGIDPGEKRSALLSKSDYKKYDYIIGMDYSNFRDMNRIMGKDPDKKLFLLKDFTNNPGEVADPYYTDNFDVCYDDIVEGLEGFLLYLKKKREI